MDEPSIPTLKFSEAKTALSEVMTAVVHKHQPQVIERRNGKEAMVLLAAEDLAEMLSGFRFEPLVSVQDGEFVASLPDFSLIAAGASLDEAMDELVDLLEEYASLYFSHLDFYRHTDRARLAPWLLRLAATPRERWLELLYEAPDEAPDEATLPRDQLRVSKQDFWRTIETGKPAPRPAPEPPEQPATHPPWAIRALVDELHMTADEIASLDEEEAVRLVHDDWSRQGQGD